MTNLKGKNVVITGGNRGIGEAIATAFAKEGSNVIITYHSDETLADQVLTKLQKLDVRANKIKVNLKDHKDRMLFFNQCYDFGDIDILINNAGSATRNSFLKLSEEEIRDVMEVNFMAPLILMQTFAQKMVAKQQEFANHNKPLKDYCMINITSISQTVIMEGISHYEASKAALNQMSKSVSIDLAKYKIRVNCIAPGIIPTDINRKVREQNVPLWEKRIQSTPLNRAGEPAEIASGVVFMANNAWVTGTTLVIDGGRSINWNGSELSHDAFADKI